MTATGLIVTVGLFIKFCCFNDHNCPFPTEILDLLDEGEFRLERLCSIFNYKSIQNFNRIFFISFPFYPLSFSCYSLQNIFLLLKSYAVNQMRWISAVLSGFHHIPKHSKHAALLHNSINRFTPSPLFFTRGGSWRRRRGG